MASEMRQRLTIYSTTEKVRRIRKYIPTKESDTEQTGKRNVGRRSERWMMVYRPSFEQRTVWLQVSSIIV
jgi:hypothetical protein